MTQEGIGSPTLHATPEAAPVTLPQEAYVFRAAADSDTTDPSTDESGGSAKKRPTVGCIIPAYNEAETIAGVLDALLMQTRMPDVIHVIINNTSDDSVEVAGHYAGPHTRQTPTGEQSTVIYIHDIGKNPDKKVGALNYGFTLIEGMDYLLGVDGDTVASEKAIEQLEEEIVSDSRIGGISAIYTIDPDPIQGTVAKFLISGQRAQFAAFNMQNMLRGRNMAVLGGQYSIFATKALRDAMTQNHQTTPWVKDSEVEDSLLLSLIHI